MGKKNVSSGKKGTRKSVEEKYQRLDQHEHILQRPDSYVGSTEEHTAKMLTLRERSITYVPALCGKKQTYIKVSFDVDKGEISVTNDGSGIPLANIFSNLWTNNMYKKNEPKITDAKPTVIFRPDFSKFGGMNGLDRDIVSLMKRRCYDVAACFRGTLKMYINNKRIGVDRLIRYVKLCRKEKVYHLRMMYFLRVKILTMTTNSPSSSSLLTEDLDLTKVCYISVNNRWEVAVCLSSEGHFRHHRSHVDVITQSVVDAIISAVSKKDKKMAKPRPSVVKNHLMIFVNALIDNPSFSSQTKEKLTTKKSQFTSKIQLPEKFLRKVVSPATGIVAAVAAYILYLTFDDNHRRQIINSRTTKNASMRGVKKLDDANNVCGRKSSDCTLILTEGDSAKALAIAGLSVIGRDNFGNEEIQTIIKVIGLDRNKDYEQVGLKSLRYGSVMIMADQDDDGSHIKGFLKQFITPIIKATRKKEVFTFYTLVHVRFHREFQNYFFLIYYKGLGTSTSKEAKEYFSDMKKHLKTFASCSDSLPQRADREWIDLAFTKSKADDRKKWLLAYDAELNGAINYNKKSIKYTDFINNELIQYSRATVLLFACFKRKLTKEIKVAQLAVSLQGTIVSMAQNFVGSNNINLLYPGGQFGTRLLGGKDHASARYVHFNYSLQFQILEKITRLIFPATDDAILEYLEDEGQMVEPKAFIPIIPMVLINGASGIATGWSTSIPNFSPRFQGDIQDVSGDGTKFNFCGTANFEDDKVCITELPVGAWTSTYKEKVLGNINNDDDDSVISSKKSKVTIKKTEFKLTNGVMLTNMHLLDYEGMKIERFYRILQKFCETRLRFYTLRKEHQLTCLRHEWKVLNSRRRFVAAVSSRELELRNRPKSAIVVDLAKRNHYVRFQPSFEFQIVPTIKTLLIIRKGMSGSKAQSKIATMNDSVVGANESDDSDVSDDENNGENNENLCRFDYLLSMPMWSLTREKVKSLSKKLKKKKDELDALNVCTERELWSKDLDALEAGLNEADKIREKEQAKEYKKLGRKFKRRMVNIRSPMKVKAKVPVHPAPLTLRDATNVIPDIHSSHSAVIVPVGETIKKTFPVDRKPVISSNKLKIEKDSKMIIVATSSDDDSDDVPLRKVLDKSKKKKKVIDKKVNITKKKRNVFVSSDSDSDDIEADMKAYRENVKVKKTLNISGKKRAVILSSDSDSDDIEADMKAYREKMNAKRKRKNTSSDKKKTKRFRL
eukprot:GSMAST32.ASY1.ANO1.1795.1 assembled CDS